MSLALVASGKLASALAAGEWLLAGVRADVCGQVVAAAEAAHADATLEGLLAGVHAHVPRQLVRAGEAPFAAVGRAGVRTLVWRRFALPASGGLPGPTGPGKVGLDGGALWLDLGKRFDGGKRRERGPVLLLQQWWFLVRV